MDTADQAAPTVVVMTALQPEYRAMREHLVNPRQEIHQAGTIAEVGDLPGTPWRVALTAAGSGNAPAAVLAERMADWFRPQALLVVGIAGALQDDIEIGDVVVATWVYGYHSGLESEAGFKARPRAWMAAHRLEQTGRLVALSDDWAATVHFRPVAAGEVSLNSRDTPLTRQLERHYNDAAAIEMGSVGAATAAHLRGSLDVLTIRGISDCVDGSTHAANEQRLAAKQAADFAVALLRNLPTFGGGCAVHEGDMRAGVRNGEPASSPVAGRRFQMGFIVDVIGYGARRGPVQEAIQERLGRVVELSLRDCGTEVAVLDHQWSGDGFIALLPADTDPTTTLPTLLWSFVQRLREDNEGTHDRMRLRMAVDIGIAGPAPTGFSGPMVVNLARLVDSPPLRAAADGHDDVDVVVMVSDQVYVQLVRPGYAGLSAAEFRSVQVAVKELEDNAWVWVP